MKQLPAVASAPSSHALEIQQPLIMAASATTRLFPSALLVVLIIAISVACVLIHFAIVNLSGQETLAQLLILLPIVQMTVVDLFEVPATMEFALAVQILKGMIVLRMLDHQALVIQETMLWDMHLDLDLEEDLLFVWLGSL